ncbi:MAG: hypothetical protein NXI10_12310 [bacterium]|nr:hypothetical protein [bacterium]
MEYKVKAIMNPEEDEEFSRELGAFVCDNKFTHIEKSYKPISPNQVQVIISGEEADILRFQARSKFKFEQIIE